MRNGRKMLLGKADEKINLDELNVDGRTILKYILKISCVLGSLGLGHRSSAGFCEHGNKSPGSIRGDEFLKQLLGSEQEFLSVQLVLQLLL
jgi:hypothetical protein